MPDGWLVRLAARQRRALTPHEPPSNSPNPFDRITSPCQSCRRSLDSAAMVSRDEIILDYLERLPYVPYPVQEEAMYAWAACEQGLLLSAPTGTGKTLVAEAAVYEGLRTGRGVYYSTPLIALTDQKLLELQDTVAR